MEKVPILILVFEVQLLARLIERQREEVEVDLARSNFVRTCEHTGEAKGARAAGARQGQMGGAGSTHHHLLGSTSSLMLAVPAV